jgi:aminoglycoside phosphotransferase (APT) family kinase protein
MNTLSVDELKTVERYLRTAGVQVAGELRATLIAGGRSNLTIRLEDEKSRWVLRMPPRAGRTPSAHDVAREHRVTSALRGSTVPVPAAVALCQDESVLGAPFAVAEFVEGTGLRLRADLDALDELVLGAVVGRLVEVLAALHRVDHLAVGLEGFGRPDGYASRQIKRWSGQLELVAGNSEIATVGAELSTQLAAAVPTRSSVGIVHGDFRIDNALLDLVGSPSVAAVLDWELSTIGDPLADVALMCAYRHPAFDFIVGAPSAWTSERLPGVEGLAAAYEAAGGVQLVDWEFHLALAYFKIGVIAAGIDHRFRAGVGSGPGFDTAGLAVLEFFAESRDALRAHR